MKRLTTALCSLALVFGVPATADALTPPTLGGYCASSNNGMWVIDNADGHTGIRIGRDERVYNGSWTPSIVGYTSDGTPATHGHTWLDTSAQGTLASYSTEYRYYAVERLAGVDASGPSNYLTCGAQTDWAPPSLSQVPPSDASIAGRVRHKAEQRSDNAAIQSGPPWNGTSSYNTYVPTPTELSDFHAGADKHNPLTQNVTGKNPLTSPSTDDLIQFYALKWGIPTDILRAEYVQESGWHQNFVGDNGASKGITQIKWFPPPSTQGEGTEPLRWESTAFNIDYQASAVRFYYDGWCDAGAPSPGGWCGASADAGQDWCSIGSWFAPLPWCGATDYIHQVRDVRLPAREWEGYSG